MPCLLSTNVLVLLIYLKSLHIHVYFIPFFLLVCKFYFCNKKPINFSTFSAILTIILTTSPRLFRKKRSLCIHRRTRVIYSMCNFLSLCLPTNLFQQHIQDNAVRKREKYTCSETRSDRSVRQPGLWSRSLSRNQTLNSL